MVVVFVFIVLVFKAVESITMHLISHCVSDSQLHLLRMRPQLLTYFTKDLRGMLDAGSEEGKTWTMIEILELFMRLNRVAFNRQLLIVQGNFLKPIFISS